MKYDPVQERERGREGKLGGERKRYGERKQSAKPCRKPRFCVAMVQDGQGCCVALCNFFFIIAYMYPVRVCICRRP